MSGQDQHEIPKIYWKQFGYIDENNRERVPVLKRGEQIIRNKNIETFTSEINIFDLPHDNIELKRMFETVNSNIDNGYSKIISSIEQYSSLSEDNESLLIQVISNFLCRSIPFRKLVFFYLHSERRENFLKTMCIFQKDKGESFISNMNLLKLEYQLNPVCGAVMDFIANKLTKASYIIINEYKNRGWITSDNPIVLENNITSSHPIFSFDTEIYFPLSKNYCAFLYYKKSTLQNNLFRSYKHREFINASEEEQKFIYERITLNEHEYLVFPCRLKNQMLINN